MSLIICFLFYFIFYFKVLTASLQAEPGILPKLDTAVLLVWLKIESCGKRRYI